MLRSGDRVGPYELFRRLGEGGQAEVWAATTLSGEVALKVLPLHSISPRSRERFDRELRAAQLVDSSRVARAYDHGTDANFAWIAYQLVAGRTLDDVLTEPESGVIPFHAAVKILSDVAVGIAAIHDRGLTHADLKPANIMVLDGGGAIVLDLGAAVFGEGSDVSRSVFGTPGWMAPEQLYQAETRPPADVFNLAQLMIKMLTGHRAFEDVDYTADIPNLVGLPPRYAVLARQALNRSPSFRPTVLPFVEAFRRDTEHGTIYGSALSRLTAADWRVDSAGGIRLSLDVVPVQSEHGLTRGGFYAGPEDGLDRLAVGGWVSVATWPAGKVWPLADELAAELDLPVERGDIAAPRNCPACGSAVTYLSRDSPHRKAKVWCPAQNTCPAQIAARCLGFILRAGRGHPDGDGRVIDRWPHGTADAYRQLLAEAAAEGRLSDLRDLLLAPQDFPLLTAPSGVPEDLVFAACDAARTMPLGALILELGFPLKLNFAPPSGCRISLRLVDGTTLQALSEAPAETWLSLIETSARPADIERWLDGPGAMRDTLRLLADLRAPNSSRPPTRKRNR